VPGTELRQPWAAEPGALPILTREGRSWSISLLRDFDLGRFVTLLPSIGRIAVGGVASWLAGSVFVT
jgi:hypothetical protein